MLDRFLDDIERGLSRTASAPQVQALLSEARDHLQQSIQARLELGASLQEAEREALDGFGASRLIVGRMTVLASARARLSWLTAYWCLLVPVLAWSAFSSGSMPDPLVRLLYALFVVVAIGFGLSAFRTAVPAPLAVLRRSAAAVLVGAAILLATHVVHESEGFPEFVPRLRVSERITSYRSMAAMALDGRLRDTSNRSQEEIAARYLRWSEELTAAAAHPLSNVLPALHLSAIFGALITLYPFAFDLLFGTVGWLVRRPRRRRWSVG